MRKITRIISTLLLVLLTVNLVACGNVGKGEQIVNITISDEIVKVSYRDGSIKDFGEDSNISDYSVDANNQLHIIPLSGEKRYVGVLQDYYLVKYFDSGGHRYGIELVKKGQKATGITVELANHEFQGWHFEDEVFELDKSQINKHLTLVAYWKVIENSSPSVPSVVPDEVYKLNALKKPDLSSNIIGVEEKGINFQYSKAQESSQGHVQLEHTGLITNTIPINTIVGIQVNFTALNSNAKLKLYYGNHALPIYNEVHLISDTIIYFKDEPSFIVIEALDKPYKLIDFHEKGHAQEYQLIEPAQPIINIEGIEILQKDLENGMPSNVNRELPKMHVDVELGPNGKPIAINNKTDYRNSLIRIEDPNNEFSLGEDEGLVAGIRLRGNSTRTLPKKPYKIKFDKKQSLFGLTSAKEWALLADYMDGSALHNFTALKFGQTVGSFNYSPSTIHIELYLNGEYQGLYLLTEHQEVNEGRIDIEQKLTEELENEDINFYIEFDRSVIYYPDVEFEGEHYFKIVVDPNEEYGTYYFSIKYPAKKDFVKAFGESEETNNRFNSFFNYVKDYTEDLLDLFKNKNNFQNFETKVDVDSLLDYLMIDYIMLETDHKYQSLKMHYIAAEDKIYFGPIWDYDSKVMGLTYEKVGVDYPFDKANDPKYTLPHRRKTFYNHFFNQFIQNYGGLDLLKARYQEVGSALIEDTLAYIENTQMYLIADNLILDANKWYGGNLSMIFENLKYHHTYLSLRKEFLDSYLT